MYRQGIGGIFNSLVFYDLQNHKILLNCKETSHLIFHIFLTNEFVILDGHIYFGGDVIKLRYNLMNADSDINEVAILIPNILALSEGETVKNCMPFVSLKFNKMVYFTQNSQNLTAFNVKILPYLHDRKV